VISSRHNDDQFRRHHAIIWLNRLLARWQASIIVISDWVGRFLQEIEGIPSEKITRIHYGLDPAPIEALSEPSYVRQQFHIPEDSPVIGTIGRLTPQKGQHYLLQAVRLLKHDFPHLRVLIIGDVELRDKLEGEAKMLDIADNIIFTGLRTYQETMRLLSGMDFFCVSIIVGRLRIGAAGSHGLQKGDRGLQCQCDPGICGVWNVRNLSTTRTS
jgi:glycosyltransferase involved in cell wall biosynthesis